MLPKRGEIWFVNLDPNVGAEIRKTRPVVVISSDYIGKLPLKLVVPVTDWKDSFTSDLWHIRLDPSEDNGISKPSAADALQSRSLDTRRFIRKVGNRSASDLLEITRSIAAIIEYQEPSE
jgi:mRNA interferase MazF